LAEHWSVSAEEVVGLGETNRLNFTALVDWFYPQSDIFLVREQTPIDYKEVSRIYGAKEPFTVIGTAKETKDGILRGEECILTYHPGISRLIIQANEVEKFEKEESLNNCKGSLASHRVDSRGERQSDVAAKDKKGAIKKEHKEFVT